MGGWGKEESFSDYTVLYGLYLLHWGDLDLGLKFGFFIMKDSQQKWQSRTAKMTLILFISVISLKLLVSNFLTKVAEIFVDFSGYLFTLFTHSHWLHSFVQPIRGVKTSKA